MAHKVEPEREEIYLTLIQNVGLTRRTYRMAKAQQLPSGRLIWRVEDHATNMDGKLQSSARQ